MSAGLEQVKQVEDLYNGESMKENAIHEEIYEEDHKMEGENSDMRDSEEDSEKERIRGTYM
jgi:hypothetical protein